jgi:hypothetical protein
MLYLCEDVGVASCSSHILCSYNLTLGFISSVYPDSVNGQDTLLIVSSSKPLYDIDNRSLHPHTADEVLIPRFSGFM